MTGRTLATIIAERGRLALAWVRRPLTEAEQSRLDELNDLIEEAEHANH